MTDQEQQTLLKIVNRTSGKYSHDIYNEDDIRQEAYIIGAEALKSYDEAKGPLEPYIARSISNRLINLVKRNEIRQNVYQAESLAEIDLDTFDLTYEDSPLVDDPSLIRLKELRDDFPASMRKDYLKVIGGVKVSPKRKEDLILFIKDNFNE